MPISTNLVGDWQGALRGVLCCIIIYVLIWELFPRLAEQSDRVLELKLVVEGAYTQGSYFVAVILFLAAVFATIGHCLFPIPEFSTISWALYVSLFLSFLSVCPQLTNLTTTSTGTPSCR